MYVLSIQEAYIHISNTIESIYIDLHERQMTQEVSMYILMFWQNNHIHEMKSHDHNINPNGNTSLRM